MKTRLIILIAGLILLVAPVLAMAHGTNRHGDGPKHSKAWVKDRHDYRVHRNDRLYHRLDRLEHKLDRQRQAKRYFKRQVKQLRHERRHVARHYSPARAYSSALVYGLPNLILHIDW